MRASCWVTKATDTRLESVIFIASRPQKQLREGTSIVRRSAVAGLFSFIRNICPLYLVAHPNCVFLVLC
jgi:hypothetical protein